MKHDVKSLASLQFNQDRTVLNRLKSFRFIETELEITLGFEDSIEHKYNQSPQPTLTVEELESLNDRLLIYTATTSTNLIKKELNLWTNHNIVTFFEYQFNMNSS
eukprot:349662_1